MSSATGLEPAVEDRLRAEICDDAIAFARARTPWRHQGRTPPYGIDCVGVIVVPAMRRGLEFTVPPNYSRQPHPRTFMELVRDNLTEISAEEARPGDVVCMVWRWSIGPQHLALLVPDRRIVHADLQKQRCTHVGYAGQWVERTHSFYRYRFEELVA